MSQRISLVDFQKQVFKEIERVKREGVSQSFVPFTSAGDRFLVNIRDIAGVDIDPKIVPYPQAPATIKGMCIVFGVHYTVFDFAGARAKQPSRRVRKMTVVTIAAQHVEGAALLVDKVFAAVPRKALTLQPRGAEDPPWVSEFAMIGKERWNVLNASALTSLLTAHATREPAPAQAKAA